MQSCQESKPTALRALEKTCSRVISAFVRRRGLVQAILSVVLLSLGHFAPLPVAHGQQVTAIDREYTIKAAFLYHFLTYIDWPEGTFSDPQQPFVIGVFEVDPFGAVLDKIAATKNVAGRRIEIRRLSSTEKLLECHIVFVAGTVAQDTQKAVLAMLANAHVLCVGETAEFAEQGAAAQFFVEGNKVRFAFNTDVVDRSKLKVSSKLLSLAKIVSTN